MTGLVYAYSRARNNDLFSMIAPSPTKPGACVRIGVVQEAARAGGLPGAAGLAPRLRGRAAARHPAQVTP